MGLSSPFPMAATSGNTSQPDSLSGNLTAYYDMVTSPLTEAAEKFQDEDLARYYQKLIGRYQLDQSSSWLAPEDGSEDPEAVPDMERINREAISLPLLEVRDDIKDKEIAAFYQDFLEKAGWIDAD